MRVTCQRFPCKRFVSPPHQRGHPGASREKIDARPTSRVGAFRNQFPGTGRNQLVPDVTCTQGNPRAGRQLPALCQVLGSDPPPELARRRRPDTLSDSREATTTSIFPATDTAWRSLSDIYRCMEHGCRHFLLALGFGKFQPFPAGPPASPPADRKSLNVRRDRRGLSAAIWWECHQDSADKRGPAGNPSGRKTPGAAGVGRAARHPPARSARSNCFPATQRVGGPLPRRVPLPLLVVGQEDG